MAIKRAWVITKSRSLPAQMEDGSFRVLAIVPRGKGLRYVADTVRRLDELLNHQRAQNVELEATRYSDALGRDVFTAVKRDLYVVSRPFCLRAQLSTIIRQGVDDDGLVEWQPGEFITC